MLSRESSFQNKLILLLLFTCITKKSQLHVQEKKHVSLCLFHEFLIKPTNLLTSGFDTFFHT